MKHESKNVIMSNVIMIDVMNITYNITFEWYWWARFYYLHFLWDAGELLPTDLRIVSSWH